MPEFCSCGAQLPPDALFCHKCGKPQRDIVEPDPAMGRHNAVKHFVDCLTDASVKMISPATDGQRIKEILRSAR